MPVLGTCAGMIVMCQEGDDEVRRTDTRLLGVLSARVDRNAFGRQRESFEADLEVEGLDSPFHAVFIRAPAVVRTWGGCRPISKLGDKVVMVRQGNLLAASLASTPSSPTTCASTGCSWNSSDTPQEEEPLEFPYIALMRATM